MSEYKLKDTDKIDEFTPQIVGTIHKLQQAVAIYLSRQMIDDISSEIGFEVLLDSYIIKMTKDQFGEMLGRNVISYPADWKEAFKERWFPDWLKKRFPVQYESFDVAVFYSEFSKKLIFPKDAHIMKFVQTGHVFPGEA